MEFNTADVDITRDIIGRLQNPAFFNDETLYFFNTFFTKHPLEYISDKDAVLGVLFALMQSEYGKFGIKAFCTIVCNKETTITEDQIRGLIGMIEGGLKSGDAEICDACLCIMLYLVKHYPELIFSVIPDVFWYQMAVNATTHNTTFYCFSILHVYLRFKKECNDSSIYEGFSMAVRRHAELGFGRHYNADKALYICCELFTRACQIWETIFQESGIDAIIAEGFKAKSATIKLCCLKIMHASYKYGFLTKTVPITVIIPLMQHTQSDIAKWAIKCVHEYISNYSGGLATHADAIVPGIMHALENGPFEIRLSLFNLIEYVVRKEERFVEILLGNGFVQHVIVRSGDDEVILTKAMDILRLCFTFCKKSGMMPPFLACFADDCDLAYFEEYADECLNEDLACKLLAFVHDVRAEAERC